MVEWERISSATQPVKEVIGPNPRRVDLENQLRGLEQRVVDLKSLNGMKEEHPTIKFLRKRIKYTKEQLENEPVEIVTQKIIERRELPPDRGAELQQARAVLAALRKKIRELVERERSLDKALANFSTTRQEYIDLTTRLSERQLDQTAWYTRLRQVRVALQAEVNKRRTHLSTVETAQKQVRPSSPSLARILTLAILGGLGFGAGLVLLANMMDRSISTTEDASKHFNIPVHGVVGEIVTATKRSRRRLVRWLVTPAASLVTMIVLFLCGMSIYLYLRYPTTHKEWKEEPVGFVLRRVTDRAMSIIE